MRRNRQKCSGAMNWKVLTGLLGGLAALITAIAALLPSLRPPPSPLSERQTSVAAPRMPTARDAEQQATRWVAAFQNADVEALVALSAPPFYMDNDIRMSKADIRSRYTEMLAKGPKHFVVTRMDARSVGEFKAAGLLGARDRFLSSMLVEDSDFAVGVFVGQEGTILFFRRSGNALEMAGFWD